VRHGSLPLCVVLLFSIATAAALPTGVVTTGLHVIADDDVEPPPRPRRTRSRVLRECPPPRGVFLAASGSEQVVLASMRGDLASRDDWNPIIGTGQSGSSDGFEKAVQFQHHPPHHAGRHRHHHRRGAGSGGQQRRSGAAGALQHALGHRPGRDGDAATAKFWAPVGLKIAPDGSIVIADTGNNVIRRLTLNR
jgi:hypothetical protein